jgi:hypothetical protein
MIGDGAIKAIVEQYERFGWKLKQVLLTPELRAALGDQINDLFRGVKIRDAKIDAAWFTREAKHGGVAWELRALRETPFALIEVMDRDATQDDLDAMHSAVEQKLSERQPVATAQNKNS